jgi:hypothetical protein
MEEYAKKMGPGGRTARGLRLEFGVCGDTPALRNRLGKFGSCPTVAAVVIVFGKFAKYPETADRDAVY